VKYTDVENQNLTELVKKKNELTAQLHEMKLKNTLGQLTNPIQIRFVRKNIARLNTAIVKKGAR
jgi:large subunit ribosomal protein L29